MPETFIRVLWAASQYLDVPVEVWATYSAAESDRGLVVAVKKKVWSTVNNAFKTPNSELGRYVHALTSLHWHQLGTQRPASQPIVSMHNTTTNTPAPVTATTPTRMDIDSMTGVRRQRDLATPASHRSRKFIRPNSGTDIQLHDNPFYLLHDPGDTPTLPATLPDSEYGDDWDGDEEAADQYDNELAIAIYEGGAMPSTSNSRRGRHSVPRAPV